MLMARAGRLKILEILCCFFRSVIALTPQDLLPCVYLCCNKIAPAFEGVEVGVGDALLIKSITEATGRTMASVKAAYAETGDLGLVAEQSRTTQKTLFKPQQLTVRRCAALARLRTCASVAHPLCLPACLTAYAPSPAWPAREAKTARWAPSASYWWRAKAARRATWCAHCR